jgi:hypothetical protein
LPSSFQTDADATTIQQKLMGIGETCFTCDLIKTLFGGSKFVLTYNEQGDPKSCPAFAPLVADRVAKQQLITERRKAIRQAAIKNTVEQLSEQAISGIQQLDPYGVYNQKLFTEYNRHFHQDGMPNRIYQDDTTPSSDVYWFFLNEVNRAAKGKSCELQGYPIIHGFLARHLLDDSWNNSWNNIRIRPVIVCSPIDAVY